ncbi:hypothetical protein ES702_04434 [subsurface metagenome]
MAIPLKNVVKAIRSEKGNVSKAAESLNITRVGLEKRISRNPKLKKIVNEERFSHRETKKDLAEDKLFEALSRGDWKAVRYILSTLGKDRGYGDTLEVKQEITERKQVFVIGETVIEF